MQSPEWAKAKSVASTTAAARPSARWPKPFAGLTTPGYFPPPPLNTLKLRNRVREIAHHAAILAALTQSRTPKREHPHRVGDVLVTHLIEGNFAPVLRGPKLDLTLRLASK